MCNSGHIVGRRLLSVRIDVPVRVCPRGTQTNRRSQPRLPTRPPLFSAGPSSVHERTLDQSTAPRRLDVEAASVRRCAEQEKRMSRVLVGEGATQRIVNAPRG
jgi:hypothetical protein